MRSFASALVRSTLLLSHHSHSHSLHPRHSFSFLTSFGLRKEIGKWRWFSHRLPESLLAEEQRLNELLSRGHIVEGILVFENKLRQHLDGLQPSTFRHIGNAYVALDEEVGLDYLKKGKKEAADTLKRLTDEAKHSSKELLAAEKEYFVSSLALANGMRDLGHHTQATHEYEGLLSGNEIDKVSWPLRVRGYTDVVDCLFFSSKEPPTSHSAQMAMDYLKKALEIAKSQKYSMKQQGIISSILYLIGNVLDRTRNTKEAARYWKIALQAAQRCSHNETIENSLNSLSRYYDQGEELEMSIRIKYLLVEHMKKIGDMKGEYLKRIDLGQTLLKIGRAIDAREEFLLCLEISRHVNDSLLIGESFWLIGHTYFLQNERSEQAHTYFMAAADAFWPDHRLLKDLPAVGELKSEHEEVAFLHLTRHPIHVREELAKNISFLRCLLSLAINLSEQGKHSEAFRYGEMAIQITEDFWHTDTFVRNISLGAVGVVLTNMNRLKQALEVLTEVYSYSVRENHKELMTYVLGWIGKVFQNRDEHSTAIAYFAKQLKISISNLNVWAQADAMRGLAWSQARLKKYEEALNVLEQHANLAVRLGQVDSAIASLNFATFFYKTIGNTQRSEEIQKVVMSLESGINQPTTHKKAK